MRRVHQSTELQERYHYASQYDAMVLAEEWVSGAEFTVAVVDGQVLPAIQLKTSHEFYDYEAKYQSDDTQYLLPCGLSEDKESELKDLVLQAFNVLGCEGWRSEEHTSELQSRPHLVCRLLLEKKNRETHI